jgi:hypothetical protein
MKILTLTLLLGLFVLSSVKAEDTKNDRIDNTIAAGIVFKVSYVIACEGPWSKLEKNNPEESDNVLASIQRDLAAFSDSKHGKMLKTKGADLLRLLRGLAPSHGGNDTEREKLLSEFGLAKSDHDPVRVATRIGELISEYARASGTPDWVYDNRKRGQTAPSNGDKPSN